MEETLKKCVNCGAEVPDSEDVCPNCGSGSFTQTDGAAAAEAARMAEAERNENVPAGIAGAILFSLIGVALYFAVYQLGIIAGICGFVICALANFGYGLFCGNKQSVSTARIVTVIIVTVAMIFLAEYVCVAFELFRGAKAEGDPISFIDALRVIPYLTGEKEFVGAVAADLGLAYLFSALACFSTISKMIKERKKRAQLLNK